MRGMIDASYDFLIVGLGDVAGTHLKVIEQIPGAEVVAAVDIEPKAGLTFGGRPLMVYRTPREAADHHKIDAVVIATPTPTHAAVCAQVAEALPAVRILVEKPAASNLADAHRVLRDLGGGQPVDVAYHMAFAPEVTWGIQITKARTSAIGVPVIAQASFADPYDLSFESAALRLGNSWIDSGINALSVLWRFTSPAERASLRRIGEPSRSVFEAHITCQADGHDLDALIVTTWHVTDPAKTTRIRYSSGAELVMDHTAVAAYLLADGTITDIFGANASVPRRERHYRALYRSWLGDKRPIATTQDHLLLHDLLLRPPAGMHV